MKCPSCGQNLVNLDLTYGYCANCLHEFDDFDFELLRDKD